jgi:hypothetical protein
VACEAPCVLPFPSNRARALEKTLNLRDFHPTPSLAVNLQRNDKPKEWGFRPKADGPPPLESVPPQNGLPRGPASGPGKALPSRRRKPATRAKYGSPSRKTGDIGAAARLSPLQQA